MKGAKRKGTAREHQSRKLLESLGYAVIRAAGSHGVFDLVARSLRPISCSSKSSRDMPGPLEREALESFQAPANCRKLIHRWQDGHWLPDVLEIDYAQNLYDLHTSGPGGN